MQALRPLLALLEQTERERDDAQVHLVRLRDAHHGARAQAEQLLAYRSDYDARWGAQPGREGGVEIVLCAQGFGTRLSQAVEHQSRIAAHAARELEAAEHALRECELRVASVRKLVERRLAEVKREADRHEQKQLDEFANRAAWRHGSSNPRYAG